MWQNLLSAPAADPNNGIAIGNGALANDLANGSNNGLYNIAVGCSTLYNNTIGFRNTVIGNAALYNNTTGYYSTAVGYLALYQAGHADFATNDTAVGNQAAWQTTGVGNTALGSSALSTYSDTGSYNLALGYGVASNTPTAGSYNILIGGNGAVDTPNASTSNFLDIGNTIFATGSDIGTVSAPAGSGHNSPMVVISV